MQRIGVVALAADIRIGAVLEKKPHPRLAFSKNSVMQSGSHTRSRSFIDQSKMGGEQGGEPREIASAGRILQTDRILASVDGLVCHESK